MSDIIPLTQTHDRAGELTPSQLQALVKAVALNPEISTQDASKIVGETVGVDIIIREKHISEALELVKKTIELDERNGSWG